MQKNHCYGAANKDFMPSVIFCCFCYYITLPCPMYIRCDEFFNISPTHFGLSRETAYRYAEIVTVVLREA